MKSLLFVVTLFSGVANAQSHGYINYTRSDVTSHIFVEQGVDGEYGRYDDGEDRKTWKGYGVNTALGIETLKFVQFLVGHTLVNVKGTDKLESLEGSRLFGGGRLVFLSPVGNLELGSGFQGSRLDYQKGLETGAFYGSGVYWSLGVNYYMSSHISLYLEGIQTREQLVRTSGDGNDSFKVDSNIIGAGFRIWL